MSNTYNYLKLENENGIGIITINRPEVYNALNIDSKMEIIKAIRECNKDPKVTSIIITGEGKAFCTGQDLNDRSVQGEKVDLGHTLETEWNPLVNSIRESKKIVIGCINGVVAGAGLSVALACDFIISRPQIKYVSGFSKLGLCPDAGSSFTLVNAMGYQKTLEFFLLAKPLLTEDLEKYGLIYQISDEPLNLAKELGAQISQFAPLSTQLIKQNLQHAMETTYKQSLEREKAAQRFLGNSEDYQEGLKAFFEKRAPMFKGN